jgi:hypothetical protein
MIEVTSPATAFFGTMGFEIVPCLPTKISRTDAWSQLLSLVTRHDRPGSAYLVVSVGAPVGDGWSFPSDDVLAFQIVEAARTGRGIVAEHVEEVFVHVWFMRSVYLLKPGTPGLTRICWDEASLQALRPHLFRIGVSDPAAPAVLDEFGLFSNAPEVVKPDARTIVES